jgi:hypothetical protein
MRDPGTSFFGAFQDSVLEVLFPLLLAAACSPCSANALTLHTLPASAVAPCEHDGFGAEHRPPFAARAPRVLAPAPAFTTCRSLFAAASLAHARLPRQEPRREIRGTPTQKNYVKYQLGIFGWHVAVALTVILSQRSCHFDYNAGFRTESN